jgi:hypothetical protein
VTEEEDEKLGTLVKLAYEKDHISRPSLQKFMLYAIGCAQKRLKYDTLRRRVLAYLWTLPRWFALPAIASSVALGCILAGASGWLTAVAIVCGGLLMAWAHVMNSVLDYSWTKLDTGSPDERSRPKDYTTGQQAIASGLLRPAGVFLSALGWLVLSVFLAVVLTVYGTPWVWLPWGLMALATFGYSYGKLHYACELVLGLGFGSFAVMLGSASSETFTFSMFKDAFLAGIPFVIMFGFAMEAWDQWRDADVNWDKGLRNLGAWVWKTGGSISNLCGWLVAMSYVVQVVLVESDILPRMSLISLVSILPYAYCLAVLEKQQRLGVLLGLLGCFSYMVLLVVGTAIV